MSALSIKTMIGLIRYWSETGKRRFFGRFFLISDISGCTIGLIRAWCRRYWCEEGYNKMQKITFCSAVGLPLFCHLFRTFALFHQVSFRQVRQGCLKFDLQSKTIWKSPFNCLRNGDTTSEIFSKFLNFKKKKKLKKSFLIIYF